MANERKEFKDERRFLVIACGSKCKDHPHERWISVDASKEQSPDIQKRLENLSEVDFKQINANTKFNIVFIEGISVPSPTIGLQQFQKAFAFVEDKGAFIQIPLRDLVYLEKSSNLDIGNFICTNSVAILIKKGGSLENTFKIFTKDCSARCTTYYPTEVIAVINQTKRLTEKYKNPYLHPMLVSVLAHLHAYVILRKERTWRNLFRDKNYDEFLATVEPMIINFSREVSSKESKEDLIKYFEQVKKKLPSSNSKSWTYTPLKFILENCESAINYYDVNLSPASTPTTDPTPQRKPSF